MSANRLLIADTPQQEMALRRLLRAGQCQRQAVGNHCMQNSVPKQLPAKAVQRHRAVQNVVAALTRCKAFLPASIISFSRGFLTQQPSGRLRRRLL